MAMTYGNVYVAQVASGANPVQVIKAFEEAEKHPGPSLIIAYVPCITHKIAGGMKESLQEARQAVESGYWSLYRYNPKLEQEGRNPMILDYKRPNFAKMIDFMMKQERFSSLQQFNPTVAADLFHQTVEQAKRRFINYAKLSGDFDNYMKRVQKNQTKKSSTIQESTLETIIHSLDF